MTDIPGPQDPDSADEAIRAELRALEGEYQARDDEPPGGDAPGAEPPPRMDWSIAAAGIVAVFDQVIAPNWGLVAAEKDALHGATIQVLDAFFPDVVVDPRVQATLVLAGTVFAIAQSRVDPATGKVRPMRLKPKREPTPDDAAQAA